MAGTWPVILSLITAECGSSGGDTIVEWSNCFLFSESLVWGLKKYYGNRQNRIPSCKRISKWNDRKWQLLTNQNRDSSRSVAEHSATIDYKSHILTLCLFLSLSLFFFLPSLFVPVRWSPWKCTNDGDLRSVSGTDVTWCFPALSRRRLSGGRTPGSVFM